MRVFGPDDRPLDDRVLLDVALAADDAVRADARAGLDDDALVDEARALERRRPPRRAPAATPTRVSGASANGAAR